MHAKRPTCITYLGKSRTFIISGICGTLCVRVKITILILHRLCDTVVICQVCSCTFAKIELGEDTEQSLPIVFSL